MTFNISFFSKSLNFYPSKVFNPLHIWFALVFVNINQNSIIMAPRAPIWAPICGFCLSHSYLQHHLNAVHLNLKPYKYMVLLKSLELVLVFLLGLTPGALLPAGPNLANPEAQQPDLLLEGPTAAPTVDADLEALFEAVDQPQGLLPASPFAL
jgi:hypothetical protein